MKQSQIKKLISGSIISTTLFISACTGISKNVVKEDINADLAGLIQDESMKPALVYIRPDAPTLADYKKFMFDPIKIDYSDPDIKNISTEDIQSLQSYFLSAMTTELNNSGYQVVTQPDKSVLRISFTLSNLKAPSSLMNATLLVVPGVTLSVGEVSIEGVFRDSISRKVNAVVYEGSQGSYLFKDKPWSTFSDIEAAFDRWAIGFTKAVNSAHNAK